jgi:hypothetical protein
VRLKEYAMTMKAAFDFIERPILYATSRAMSWVYRTISIAPGRQVAAWEMFVATIELLLVTYAFHLLRMVEEQMLVYVLPVMMISKVLDLFVSYRKFKRISPHYDVRSYRQAFTDAESHRVDRVFIRFLVLSLVVFAFLLFSVIVHTTYNWAAVAIAVYFALYASTFYVRAAEPPRPDEGDFFAIPKGIGA